VLFSEMPARWAAATAANSQLTGGRCAVRHIGRRRF
jgi:hypothetical protein